MNNNAVIKKSNTLKNFRDTQYIIQSKLAKIIPSGTVLSYVANLPPNGWLICDGSEVSRQIYSKLFNVIGETYGAGDTETTFNLPNLIGRVIIGTSDSYDLGDMGGSETHTLTTNEMPSHTHTPTLGSAGEHTHTGTTSTDGSHAHTYQDVAYTENGGSGINDKTGLDGPDGDNGFYWRTAEGGISNTPSDINTSTAGAHSHTLNINSSGSHTHSLTIANTGGGEAHNIMQPYTVVNYIIKI
jgi:microcystin-dependent protein